MNTIFYSWLSELPNKTNRGYIKDCLEKAIKQLNQEASLELSLDRDTQGKSGSPDIAESIFGKIEEADVFVCDVTLCSEDKEKGYINSNVAIELGYAAGVLGWDRIVCVFNEHYGPVTDLPFDLRSRRILPYNKGGDSDTEKSSLIQTLKVALQSGLDQADSKLQEIRELYRNETKKAQRHVILQSDFGWEVYVFQELFNKRYQNCREEYELIKAGHRFSPPFYLSHPLEDKWLKMMIEKMYRVLRVYKNAYNRALLMAFTGQAENSAAKSNPDPILIHKASLLLIHGFQEVNNWAIEVTSIVTKAPKKLNNEFKHEFLRFSEVLYGAGDEIHQKLNSFNPEEGTLNMIVDIPDTGNASRVIELARQIYFLEDIEYDEDDDFED